MDTQPQMSDTIPANIAIIGMACRFPGADDVDQFWRNTREGVESIRTFDDDQLREAGVPSKLINDPSYVKCSAPINDVAGFDAGYFGFVKRDVEMMDPQHRIFLECAVWALEDGGYDPDRYDGLIGVYAGSTMNTYLLMNLIGNGMVDVVGDHAVMIGNDKDYLPMRVAYKLGLRGPACAVQTACSTSLTAVHVASQAILAGECDMALAGGASVRMPHGGGYLQNATASPDGHCRAFDARAQGSVVGNGAGAVLLKHLDDAIRDNDHIYAVIVGSATSNDGSQKSTFTAPSVDGQARAAAGALAAAGLTADDVDYVEAHGTGTPLGDPIEVAALTKAFRMTSGRRQDCAIGSVKPNIGHLDAAAGVASLIKAVQALRHHAIPPVLHFTRPNPEIDFANSPFYVPDELTDWEAGSERPRRAGVHSLGMGGANAHVVVEEAPRLDGPPSGPAHQLVLLSAKAPQALAAATANLADWLGKHPQAELADVAFTLQVGRGRFRHRCAVVARDVDDAATVLATPGSSRLQLSETPMPAARLAFLFPGQGAQFVGMGADLYRTESTYRHLVEECLGLLPDRQRAALRTHLLGRRDPASEALADTALAQPALFIVEYALARTLESWGLRADMLLGHSIGEYIAATLAGVFSLADALRVVVARGELVSALPHGAMLSLPVPEETARTLAAGHDVCVAAVNAEALVAVAGSAEAMDKFETHLADHRLAGRRLRVSHAFHSAMMDPVLEEFEATMRSVVLRPPSRPVISNVTGAVHDEQTATDPRYWVEHLRRTVRFADGVATATAAPGTVLAEVGPGNQLTRLVLAQTNRDATPAVVPLMNDASAKASDRVALLGGLGRLWQAGVDPDWARTHDQPRRRLALPPYPFQRSQYWVSPGEATLRAPARAAESSDPHNWFYQPRWTQAGEAIAAGVPGAVLLLTDDCGIGECLAGRLRRAGSRVVTATRGTAFAGTVDSGYVLDPAEADHWDRLSSDLASAGFTPDAYVHLWGLDAPEPSGDTPSDIANLHRLVRLAGSREALLMHVTRHVFDVTGEDPIRPEMAAAVGICRVVPQETALRCRVVESDPRPLTDQIDSLVEHLVAELSTAEPRPAVLAIRGRRSHHQVWAAVSAPAGARVPARGVHVVIGGLGRVGSTLAEHLLRDPDTTVVVYDSAPPAALTAQQHVALSSLREIGMHRLELITADAADADHLRRVVEQLCARHGELAGVIYAPGLPVSESIGGVTDKPELMYQRHFQTKGRGLRALDAALRDMPVAHCLIVGSLASVLGGIGSAGYTAANCYLDAYVERRNRTTSSPWRNVLWDHWIDPGAPGFREDTGCTREDSRAVLDAIARLTVPGPLAVSVQELNTRADSARIAERAKSPKRRSEDVVPLGDTRPPDLSTAYVAPRDELETYLASVWSDLLGIGDIGILDGFFELGGESLALMQMLTRLRAEYNIELPLDELYKDTTITALADLLRGGGTQAAAPPVAVDDDPLELYDDPDELARLLSEIEILSETEVQSELSRPTDQPH